MGQYIIVAIAIVVVGGGGDLTEKILCELVNLSFMILHKFRIAQAPTNVIVHTIRTTHHNT
jgi:hypothetical protein